MIEECVWKGKEVKYECSECDHKSECLLYQRTHIGNIIEDKFVFLTAIFSWGLVVKPKKSFLPDMIKAIPELEPLVTRFYELFQLAENLESDLHKFALKLSKGRVEIKGARTKNEKTMSDLFFFLFQNRLKKKVMLE